jgi:hypothetical protein
VNLPQKDAGRCGPITQMVEEAASGLLRILRRGVRFDMGPV